jgi:hypothetical protein
VDLSGWSFTSGVQFTIPSGRTIAAGGFLVVAANQVAFQTKYPAVTNFVAGWNGHLSNSSNKITLKDNLAVTRDEVQYSDDGDWAPRVKSPVLDFGHRGWEWDSGADGNGKSLELINPLFDNNLGQNWAASTANQGTPGAPNSVGANDIAPVILDAEHFPLIPTSSETVAVTVRVVDDHASPVTVVAHYRNDGEATFSSATMADDGAHGDAAAGDGIYGATLLEQPAGTIVEFYFTATDNTSHTRAWPAPAFDENGLPLTQDNSANCFYQVDDATYAGAQPYYKIIMHAADRQELADINANVGGSRYSHAKMNATWITRDGTGALLRYLVGVRNRGHGSATRQPQSFNVAFRNDDKWKSATALNLNTQYTYVQFFGSALFRAAGIAAPESRPAQVRVNNVNPTSAGSPSFGFYVANEVQNSDFADHHFPLDSSGNLYRAQRTDTNPPANQMADAYLEYQAPDVTQQPPDPYRAVWFKQTNTTEDEWTDLIGLTQALAKGHSDASLNTTYDPGYQTDVEARVDVEEWMRFFAAETLVNNMETNISRGYGDDYYLYFGVTDSRAKFVPYDLDTICGQGDVSQLPTTPNLFRMGIKDDSAANGATPLNAFMKHPAFAPIYYKHLKELIDGPFATANFNSLVDNTLNGVVSQTRIDSTKTFQNARTAFIATQIPLNISVTTSPAVQNGYPHTTTSTTALAGNANAITTRSVKVNGVTATWTAWNATWSAPSVTLVPGINRVLIQAFDANNAETERTYFDVWYDDASVANVSGAIAGNTTWTAAGGPYQVTAALTVNSGVTLTIQSGATVYLASGTGITVAAGGRILAEGTEIQPIRFTRAPGSTGNGGTILINGQAGAPETHFYYTFFEFGGDPAVTCAANSNVILDHCEWLRNDVAYLHLDGGSFVVSNCIFPSSAPGAYFEGVHGANAAPPAGGRAIIRDCFFGKISSNPSGGDYNDVLDFTGGNRPGPILQVINNVFIGTDDDILDIDGTDMWAEGNIFMHVHRNGSPDSASAISGGNDGGGGTGSRKVVTAIDVATDQVMFGSAHGFSTGQEIVATTLLGNTFPVATPPLHDGSYFARAISTTVVKLYTTAADANADTNAVDFTGTIGTNISLSLCKLDAISHITIVGNLFYDVDQAATAKEGNFYTFLNNTVVAQNNVGSQDTVTGVLNFGDDTYHEAGGMYAEGNIIHSARALTRHYPGGGLAQTVVWNNNLFPPGMSWTGAGGGNQSADALLNDTAIPTPGPRDYVRVAAEIREKFGLRPGSPAKGTGPNGTDKGGVRPFGVSVSGAPSGTTNAITATLTVGTRMSGNGIPAGQGAWQNGAGWTHYKWRINGGAWSGETLISTPISLSGLTNGTKIVDVVGKNDASFYQDDAAFGPDARISSVSWIVDTTYVPPGPAPLVHINEVLAKNTETINFGTNFPDIIELRNAGNAVADLSGWGLTDNTSLPYKYTFPAGTTILPGAYYVIYASGSSSVPQPKTGFGLKEGGDTLTLTRSVAAGGGVADAIPFGAQLPDYSIGRRVTDGNWDMCVPTFGAPNVVAAQASPHNLKINEWLADAVTLFGQDFIELYNPASLPTNIGNGYLTDNPVEWPDRSQIRQLTFVAAGGYVVFKADGDIDQGPDHLDFKLAATQGEIGLFDSALNLIDNIVYGSQSSDVSEGRTPNGASTIVLFNQPTPGAPNPGSLGGTTITITNLIPATQTWKWYGTTDAPPLDAQSRDFTNSAYDDTSWSSGAQLLYIETAALTNGEGFTKTTVLPGLTTTKPYQTYYFRTHFTYSGTLTGITLTAKVMVDDGCILYLNGQEFVPTSGSRIGMAAGPVTYTTLANRTVGDAAVETFTLPTSALVVGDNVLAVEVHQVSNQSGGTTSSDIVWGMKLDASETSAVGGNPVVINEVLPVNATLQNPDSSFAGWIELFNPGTSAADISDMSLTNDLSNPRAFVFPGGTSIPANGYLVIYCNPLLAQSPTNTGFALSGVGDEVYFFKGLADGGGLQDAVVFGCQVPDFSVGRSPNGTGPFALSVPTRGALNQAAGLGPITAVKLNEWLGTPKTTAAFFELFNTGAQPVLLAGNYLTDALTNKTKFLIPPLSFVGGAGNSRWLQYIADNDNGATPGHVNFNLSAGENLGLFSGSGTQLDAAFVSAQIAGVSQGRFPDGSATIVSMPPTPAAMNKGTNADSDIDGLPDIWEITFALNPNDPSDAASDADGDGRNNREEYLAGTDPRNGSSVFAARVVPGPGTGQWTVRFVAIAGKPYSVLFKNSLSDATWTKLSDVPAQGATGEIGVVDSGASGMARRFYQVVTPQVP